MLTKNARAAQKPHVDGSKELWTEETTECVLCKTRITETLYTYVDREYDYNKQNDQTYARDVAKYWKLKECQCCWRQALVDPDSIKGFWQVKYCKCCEEPTAAECPLSTHHIRFCRVTDESGPIFKTKM